LDFSISKPERKNKHFSPPKIKIGMARISPRSMNRCAKCGKVIGQKEGGFMKNQRTGSFDLVCSGCFKGVSVKEEQQWKR